MCTCAVVLQGTEIAGIKMQISVNERFVICRHDRCLTMCRLLVAPSCEYEHNKKLETDITQTEWTRPCRTQ